MLIILKVRKDVVYTSLTLPFYIYYSDQNFGLYSLKALYSVQMELKGGKCMKQTFLRDKSLKFYFIFLCPVGNSKVKLAFSLTYLYIFFLFSTCQLTAMAAVLLFSTIVGFGAVAFEA